MQPLQQASEDPTRHVTVTIRHEMVESLPNDGWFPETGIEHVARVEWQNEQYPSDRGQYWIGQANGSPIWFHDGKDRIAAVNDWRVRRYLYRGLNRRFNSLLRDYLGNGLIDIPDGALVINFGANIGEVAVALNRKGASVMAIEPDPDVLPALIVNTKGRCIDVIQAVAWKDYGIVDLYIATEKGDTSVINPSPEKIPAYADAIDSLVSRKYNYGGYQEPLLIVGDAEGAEPEVLLGATETLKRTRYVSIRVGAERNGKCPGPECREILERAGFAILMDENEILIGENGEVYT